MYCNWIFWIYTVSCFTLQYNGIEFLNCIHFHQTIDIFQNAFYCSFSPSTSNNSQKALHWTLSVFNPFHVLFRSNMGFVGNMGSWVELEIGNSFWHLYSILKCMQCTFHRFVWKLFIITFVLFDVCRMIKNRTKDNHTDSIQGRVHKWDKQVA